MVDDQGFDWTAAAFEFKAKAIYDVENRSDQVLVIRIIGRQIVVV
jgi:hypothetical protein